ncbi:hypothetical protein ILUMI_19359 [Ignelater luminosus]|uniref:Uncharacterized protein n=1 Tax=Ignelater luminosus TaxID=2038154 RepID=A0A8K0G5J7_IGNLU|nr:hypothetical protein ILUMI_19359 [Ignelater luminosus]
MDVTVGILLFGFYLLKGIRKFFACQITVNEGNKTKILVHKLLLRTKRGPVANELIIFSKQLLHVRLRFTAAGLCPLDGTALYWAIGFTPSILIVLLQFHSSLRPLHCTAFTQPTNLTIN